MSTAVGVNGVWVVKAPDMAAEIRRLEQENAALRPYAKLGLDVLDYYWRVEYGDIDGCDMHEMIRKCGVVVDVPYDPIADDGEWGDEWGQEAGDPFPTTPGRAAVRAALAEPPKGETP